MAVLGSPSSPSTPAREAASGDGPVRPDPLPPGKIPLAPNGRTFIWGPIQAIHAIGDYQIVEYLKDASNHSASQPEAWAEHGRTRFHPYVNGQDIHRSCSTLDSALITAIAYQRRGPNSQAAWHFDLMTLGSLPAEPAGSDR